eukprot:4193766-Alexandrium_andersonii.AAC.1
MSASLVGSEMCIRDSGGRCNRHFTMSSSAAQRARVVSHGENGVACPIPVSYTHLTLPTICSV